MPLPPQPPIPDPATAGRSLLYDALAQNDVDMAFHRLLNLDTSNLPPVGIPPTIVCNPHNWLNGWDAPSQTWSQRQPNFTDISGPLTTQQQSQINQVGVIRAGQWQGSVIAPLYLPTLDLLSPPATDLNINHFKLINVANPINPQDAVTLAYMDDLLLGLNPKEAVRVASTIFHTPSGLDIAVDGVFPVAGDRILLTAQSPSSVNGIYIAAAGPWSRSPDAANAAGLNRAYCNVLQGLSNAGTAWIQLTVLTDPIGSQDVDFELFWNIAAGGGGGTIIAGRGLDFTGNTLNVVGTTGRIVVNALDPSLPVPDGGVDIDPNYVGQTSINTLGTVTSGGWQGQVIQPHWGGTGYANLGTLSLPNASLQVIIPGLAPPPATLVLEISGNSTLILPTAGTLATLAGTETFFNKQIIKRMQKIASNPKPSIDTDEVDVFYIESLNSDITSMSDNLSGTFTDGQELIIWIKAASGGPVTFNIFWGAMYDASPSLPLPTVAQTNLWMFHRFIFNVDKDKFVLVAFLQSIPM